MDLTRRKDAWRSTNEGAFRIVVGAGAIVAAIGCWSGAAAASGIPVDQHARSLLPSSVAKSGTLKVATELDWPPFTYKSQSGAATGSDIALIKAVAGVLGLRASITDLADAAVIPSIQNGRFDVAVSQLVDTPQRRSAVNFVDYISNPLGLMIRRNELGKISPNALCGHTLVATTGTGPLTFGQQYSKVQCEGKGKPAINFQVFGDSASTLLALANGRGEGFIADPAVGRYQAKTSKKGLVMATGVVPGSKQTRSGIAFSKQNPQLGAALRAALLALMKDGAYQKILRSWHIGEEALTSAAIRAQGTH